MNSKLYKKHTKCESRKQSHFEEYVGTYPRSGDMLKGELNRHPCFFRDSLLMAKKPER